MPPAEIASRFQIDPLTVRKLASQVANIDPAHVATLRHALPNILTMLGAAHGMEALARVHSDPAMSVKSTFGAKLAVEAAKLSQPQAEAPGKVVLTIIQSFGEARHQPALEVASSIVEAEVVSEPACIEDTHTSSTDTPSDTPKDTQSSPLSPSDSVGTVSLVPV